MRFFVILCTHVWVLTTGRVIATVFKFGQTLQKDRSCLLFTCKSYYSAHSLIPLFLSAHLWAFFFSTFLPRHLVWLFFVWLVWVCFVFMGFSYPIHPVSYPLIIFPLLNFLFKPLSSSPLSWVVDWFWWLVWLSGFLLLCCGFSCVVVFGLFCFLWGFLYPIHPVYLTLIFTPHLKLLTKPNLSVLVLVKVMRNSTYKVGWEEW